jgi:hypothetical protein
MMHRAFAHGVTFEASRFKRSAFEFHLGQYAHIGAIIRSRVRAIAAPQDRLIIRGPHVGYLVHRIELR